MYQTKPNDHVDFHQSDSLGDPLTKRELFAVKAMQALITAGKPVKLACKLAVAAADGLIEALQEECAK